VRSPVTPQISSFAAAETTRRVVEACIREIQDLPASSMRIISGVELADGVATPVAHKLGRAPVFVGISVPRGATAAGWTVETCSGSHDRSQVVVLTANDYGATITIDLAVL
jgi:hypothetical protein